MKYTPLAVHSGISIHALLAESDKTNGSTTIPYFNFYPRSPCGERRNARPDTRLLCAISIHALLAESDLKNHIFIHHQSYFYPRSPCGERHGILCIRPCDVDISIHALLAESDGRAVYLEIGSGIFLSTLSLRRATPRIFLDLTFHQNFYPRSPCGERLRPG